MKKLTSGMHIRVVSPSSSIERIGQSSRQGALGKARIYRVFFGALSGK